jgi:hypothetical protein
MTPRELANEHSRKHNARTTSGGSDAPKKIRELQERIKRLEEAGDAMEKYIFDQTNTRFIICAIQWRKAKEAKP